MVCSSLTVGVRVIRQLSSRIEAIEYVQGVEYKAAEWTNIYGTDKKFVVRGGDIEWEEKDGKIVVKSVSPLSLDKVEG